MAVLLRVYCILKAYSHLCCISSEGTVAKIEPPNCAGKYSASEFSTGTLILPIKLRVNLIGVYSLFVVTAIVCVFFWILVLWWGSKCTF